MDVCCKKCNWTGQVFVGYKKRLVKRNKSRFAKKAGTVTRWVRTSVPTEDTIGIPATSIPCPNCKEHQLERITRCIRRRTSKTKSS